MPWSLEATSKEENKPEPGWTTAKGRDEVPANSRQSAEIVYKFTLFFLDTPFTGKVARTKFENKKIFQKGKINQIVSLSVFTRNGLIFSNKVNMLKKILGQYTRLYSSIITETIH